MDFQGTAWCLKPLKQGPLWCLEGTNCIRYIALTNFCSAQKGVRRQLNMFIYIYNIVIIMIMIIMIMLIIMIHYYYHYYYHHYYYYCHYYYYYCYYIYLHSLEALMVDHLAIHTKWTWQRPIMLSWPFPFYLWIIYIYTLWRYLGNIYDIYDIYDWGLKKSMNIYRMQKV